MIISFPFEQYESRFKVFVVVTFILLPVKLVCVQWYLVKLVVLLFHRLDFVWCKYELIFKLFFQLLAQVMPKPVVFRNFFCTFSLIFSWVEFSCPFFASASEVASGFEYSYTSFINDFILPLIQHDGYQIFVAIFFRSLRLLKLNFREAQFIFIVFHGLFDVIKRHLSIILLISVFQGTVPFDSWYI